MRTQTKMIKSCRSQELYDVLLDPTLHLGEEALDVEREARNLVR